MKRKEDKFVRNKKPWSTKNAMQQIYEKNLWGGVSEEFYSGIGSHDPQIVVPYINVITEFLTSFETPLTICDLGCGDFNIGKELVLHSKKYIAVDIVPELIKHNRETFKEDHLEFYCLDIAKDALPMADCVIIRQVLQHLSNAEVQQIATKLTHYKYILLTEHLPQGDFTPNIDIIAGQGIRLKKGSGINLLAPLFHLKIKEEKQLLPIASNKFKGEIVTTLYKLF